MPKKNQDVWRTFEKKCAEAEIRTHELARFVEDEMSAGKLTDPALWLTVTKFLRAAGNAIGDARSIVSAVARKERDHER